MTHTVSQPSGSAVVTPHALATRAAVEVMSAGGNAVDGAVAANAVLGVVLPTTCGVGGDLFAMVHTPGEATPDALNASGRGGTGLDPAAMRAAGHTEIPLYGPESVSVPGCVDGWEALLQRHGTMTLGDLLDPAIRLAINGFEVSSELSSSLARLRDRIRSQASAPPLYPGGDTPAPGTTITRPGLAATLKAIAGGGRAAFYESPTAAAIEEATGGTVTVSDLTANRPDWVEPIGIGVFGVTAWTMPPNSQGYLTVAAAWLFDQLDVPPDPADPAFHHATIECYRAVAWEREEMVADPDHTLMDPARLLDPSRLEPRLATLRSGVAGRWPAAAPMDGGTAYLCTADASGMGVSLIQSNFHGIGVGISAGDTGVWLHNRAGGFNLLDGHPNEAAPGKRPLHTLSPTLWTAGDRLHLLLGTRGGHQQPQYLLQAAALLHHADSSPADTQDQPRWSMGHAAAGTASVVQVEEEMSGAIVTGLAGRGHQIERVPGRPRGWGPVSIIAADPDGTLHPAADPRVTTATAATAGTDRRHGGSDDTLR